MHQALAHLIPTMHCQHVQNTYAISLSIHWNVFFPQNQSLSTFLIFRLCSPLWYPVGWTYFSLCYPIVVSSWCYPVQSSASADGLVPVSQLWFLLFKGWKRGCAPISCNKTYLKPGLPVLGFGCCRGNAAPSCHVPVKIVTLQRVDRRNWAAATRDSDHKSYSSTSSWKFPAGVPLQWC